MSVSRLKVLLVHNYYGSTAPSGENTAVDADCRLIEQMGHDLYRFSSSSDDIRKNGSYGQLVGGVAYIWNPVSAYRLQLLAKNIKPDVIHIHNTFPLLSPSVIASAKGTSAAVVVSMHNLRVFCAAAIPLRNQVPCVECIDRRSVLPALKYGCYRNSRTATLPIAMSIEVQRRLKIYESSADIVLALTEFQKSLLVRAGMPASLIEVRPNYSETISSERTKNENGFLYVGRVSEEKGVDLLVAAWRLLGADAPTLRIVGDGPQLNRLRQDSIGLPIEFEGQLSADAARLRISESRILIIPSRCFEGLPMTLVEAFSAGVPVAVSNLGPLPDLLDKQAAGWIFEPNDPKSIASLVRAVNKDPRSIHKKGLAAHALYEKKYSKTAAMMLLSDLYDKAITKKSAL